MKDQFEYVVMEDVVPGDVTYGGLVITDTPVYREDERRWAYKAKAGNEEHELYLYNAGDGIRIFKREKTEPEAMQTSIMTTIYIQSREPAGKWIHCPIDLAPDSKELHQKLLGIINKLRRENPRRHYRAILRTTSTTTSILIDDEPEPVKIEAPKPKGDLIAVLDSDVKGSIRVATSTNEARDWFLHHARTFGSIRFIDHNYGYRLTVNQLLYNVDEVFAFIQSYQPAAK